MNKIKFTADSTCDLSAELVKKLDVDIMSLVVTLGDKDFRDGVDVFPEDIYKFVAEKKILPKTAAPSPDDYRAMFSKFSKEYDAVIHFNISADMSASNQNAQLAAADFKNVHVIDSRSLSTGTSLLILKAQALNEQGKSVSETVQTLKALTGKVQASFVIDTLEYLHKGGRCSGMEKLGAAILRLHPMLLVKDGNITVFKKLRGKMALVYNDYVNILHQSFPNPDKKHAFITHTSCSEEVIAGVKDCAEKLFGFENIHITGAGSTITSHCGKGTLGLLFINDTDI